MTDVIFYFDFGSPNAYLAHKVIPAIEQRTGAKFGYVPALLGGIFKATGNRRRPRPSRASRPSCAYEGKETRALREAPRHHRVRPQPALPGQHAADHARRRGGAAGSGVFEAYVEAVYRAMWVEGLKMDDPAVIVTALTTPACPPTELIALTRRSRR